MLGLLAQRHRHGHGHGGRQRQGVEPGMEGHGSTSEQVLAEAGGPLLSMGRERGKIVMSLSHAGLAAWLTHAELACLDAAAVSPLAIANRGREVGSEPGLNPQSKSHILETNMKA